MALDDPPPPWAPTQWDDYIQGFPTMGMQDPSAPAVPPVEQPVAAPVEQPTIQMPDEHVGQGAAPPVAPEQVAAQPPPGPPGLLTPPPLDRPPTIDMPDDYVGHQAPPMFTPDGVSGGAVPDQVDRILGYTTATGDTAGKPEGMPDDYMTGQELGVAMAGRSPEEQAKFVNDLQTTKDNLAATEMMKASEDQRRRLEANIAARQAADRRAADLDVQAKQLANTDPMDNIPGYTKVLGVVASIFGGFAMNKTGRNVGLETVNQIADEAARQQQQKIQLLGKQRGDIISDADAAYRAGEATRLAVYDIAMNKIKTDVQQLDPRGTQAAQLMLQYNGFATQRAQIAAQNHANDLKQKQQEFENNLKLGELGIKLDEQGLKQSEFDFKKQQAMAKMGGAATPVAVYGKVYPSYNEIDPKDRKFAFTLPSGKGVMLANNEKNAEQAQAISEAYGAANYDLNQLQKIAMERNNRKSLAGSAADRWRDADERRFQQLIVDFANRYGTTIHGGRPVPAGTLEEILHQMPALKSIVDGGDTTVEVSNLRDDMDNRVSENFSTLSGSPVRVQSNRPTKARTDVGYIAEPLKESKPVVGAAGYVAGVVNNSETGTDVGGDSAREFDQRMGALFNKYKEQPTLGGDTELKSDINTIIEAQEKAIQTIKADLHTLEGKQKLTPEEQARLDTGPRAIASYEQKIAAARDWMGKSAERAAAQSGKEADAKVDRDLLLQNAGKRH